MSFSETQMRALKRSVAQRNVRVRVNHGKELSYIEGWYAVAEANRIFGFDGWNRETLETRCLFARENRGVYAVAYIARVRITVRAGDRVIVREGHGTAEGKGSLAVEAHDLALKSAETDATKRALATFGKAFGLALYANGAGRRAVSAPDKLLATDKANGASPHAPDHPTPLSDISERATSMVDVSPPVAVNGASFVMRATEAETQAGQIERGISQLKPTSKVDKSMLALGEPRRVRDKEHLQYVASQPCLLCSTRPSDAHHIRFAQPRALGRKVGDEFTVPLCRKHHRELHHSGDEASWWHDMNVDALEVARQLWDETETRRRG
jgi:DNA recombination protein Rad52